MESIKSSKTLNIVSLAVLTMEWRKATSLDALNIYNLIEKLNPLTNIWTLSASFGKIFIACLEISHKQDSYSTTNKLP